MKPESVPGRFDKAAPRSSFRHTFCWLAPGISPASTGNHPRTMGSAVGGLGMRVLLAFLIGLVTAAFVAAAVILVVQNGQGERLTFLGLSFSGYVGWDLAAAAGLGF